MWLFELLRDEIMGFLSVGGIVDIIRSGDYSSLRTWGGFSKVISPLIPFLVLIEVVVAFLHKKFHTIEYRIPFLTYVFNRIAGRYISIGVIGFCLAWVQPVALFHLPVTWYGFIVSYVIWEFSHFVYHYLAHKVRLLWCLHSTHHAPEAMNLSVTYTHFLLEAPYADLIRSGICLFLGVEPVMLFTIMFVDGTWGAFIHVGENFIKDARFGFLGNWLLTPSHHRVHHARNPIYMDTNFCNLLNIWDRVFRTYQPEKSIPIEYGITRKINAGNFFDVYFGELYYLARDIAGAPGFLNKIKYIVMPPGWSHTGDHKTATVIRRRHLEENPGPR